MSVTVSEPIAARVPVGSRLRVITSGPDEDRVVIVIHQLVGVPAATIELSHQDARALRAALPKPSSR